MENKNIEKITNEELFQEFKRRGFFTMPENIEGRENLDAIVVSVEEPKKDIYITRKQDWNEKTRGEVNTN
ncbi:hypothetical protein CLU96_2471 [Chryseobacterium sp. 52]|uniref:hypothetical protein n=1 Tax=Chryseobacterium sp. 52 TaxID=2035213 RepID=UPI000C179E58|nr:hypothetical protein [Chryseobacterium sp. 52]PIF45466.1 hypothetical protein CLU96_2471 [Chryseobacterium sp. 52]